MSDLLRKPDWIPYYIQRMKGSKAYKSMQDFEFGWYSKLLVESADSDVPGYLPNDVRTLWRLAGARTEKFFRERGGMELVARYFSRTDDGLWIYNVRMLEVLHEQMTKLTKRRRSRLSSLSLFLQELPSCIPGEVFQEYINMREKKKKPMTPYAMKLTIAKLEKLHEQGQSVKDILEAAITNCWTGVWPLEQVKNGNQANNGNGQNQGAAVNGSRLAEKDCPICSGSGFDLSSGKATRCACWLKNRNAHATNGTTDGRGKEPSLPGASVPKVQAASAGND